MTNAEIERTAKSIGQELGADDNLVETIAELLLRITACPQSLDSCHACRDRVKRFRVFLRNVRALP